MKSYLYRHIDQELNSKETTTSKTTTTLPTIPSTVKITTTSTSSQTSDLNRLIETISTTSLSTSISLQDVTSHNSGNTTPLSIFTTNEHSIATKKPQNDDQIVSITASSSTHSSEIDEKTTINEEMELNTVSLTMLSTETMTVESSTNQDEYLEKSNTPFYASTSIPETIETTKASAVESISTLTTTNFSDTKSNGGKKSVNRDTDQSNTNV